MVGCSFLLAFLYCGYRSSVCDFGDYLFYLFSEIILKLLDFSVSDFECFCVFDEVSVAAYACFCSFYAGLGDGEK